MQAAIAARVAEALGVALGVKEQRVLAARPTQNLEAYKAYLRGEAVWAEIGASNPSVIRQAIPYYQQAVALDSGFVEAWYRLRMGAWNAAAYATQRSPFWRRRHARLF